jgi:hypothetical protein
MSIAYIITAYKYPRQLARLIHRIEMDVPRSPVWVHVDRKVDIRPFVEACGDSAATFVEPRISVTWGSFSMVRATLRLLEMGVNSGASHIVLLSEQCYPLRRLSQFEAFLSAHPDSDYIGVRQVSSEWTQVQRRYGMFHIPELQARFPRATIQVLRLLRRLRPRRTPPGGLEVFGGSAWWTLSAASARHVLESYRSDRRLRWFFRLTSVPEELYVHTVLANSHRSPHLKGPVTYARFDREYSKRHPLVWTVRDLDELEASSMYFARKFDETVDSAVMDHLDRQDGPSSQ